MPALPDATIYISADTRAWTTTTQSRITWKAPDPAEMSAFLDAMERHKNWPLLYPAPDPAEDGSWVEWGNRLGSAFSETARLITTTLAGVYGQLVISFQATGAAWQQLMAVFGPPIDGRTSLEREIDETLEALGRGAEMPLEWWLR